MANPFRDANTPADSAAANAAAMLGTAKFLTWGVPPPSQPSITTHELSIPQWRALGKIRCAFLWEALPAQFLTPHLGCGGKWLVLLCATLDYVRFLAKITGFPQAPAGLPEREDGLLSGKPSTDAGNENRRLERVAMWRIMDELPNGWGWGCIYDLGGDAQDRVLYLEHRYIKDLEEIKREDDLFRAAGLRA